MRRRRPAEGQGEPGRERRPGRIRLIPAIFMLIGVITVVYFLVTLVLLPVLAALTPHS